ncbi:unnamed protein product [Clonostachys byssicola]|uniref:FAD-binding domain-containing protein n=1 Tax=Clonostachys byssicola TaxID=160290 RepID=A0A9N9UAD3_9HYPO|nr:unnamed protein product [Clonostachys byssicola]
MENRRIRIGIIGGGLAGASIANSLSRIPSIAIDVFEAAPEFSERGAAVGLALPSQRALQELLEDAKETLRKAQSVPIASSRFMLGSGPHAGTVVVDFGDAEKFGAPELIVHRASLLRELLAPLPESILHPNKKMISIVKTDAGVKVYFADGTDYEFDAVIGADGVFGTVRDHVLADEAKQYSASPAGFWDCRVLVPFEKAKAVLGEDLFKLDRQYGWAGDGAFLLHDVLENGTVVHCVISAVEHESPPDRKHKLTREFLNKTLANWLDGPIASGIIDLVLEQDDPRGYSEWEHKATPTYARGRVCIMGDAAHASTPFQAAGAGQAFEDGMILSALLGHISSPDDIEAAFKVYDEVRRPRCQRVIDSSRGTGLIMCGRSEAGLDPEKILQAVAPRWDFLNLDLKSYVQEAVQKLDERLGA